MDPFGVVAIIGFGLASLALFNGVVSMAHGGEADQHASHVLMFKRIGWQAMSVLAVGLGLLAYLH